MKTTQILMDEHRVIERVLDALEAAAGALERGEGVRPGFFLDAAEFISGFADGCHHHKEEGVLFEAMAAQGMPTEEGPIGVMLAEHEQGRAYTKAMREAAGRLEQGDDDARAQVVNSARGYVALLRQHIAKEDTVLFPMAEQVIPRGGHERMLEDFERVEREETGEGVHERYHALAEKLAKEATGER
jgi:hemerythrin-like domain-containing protein